MAALSSHESSDDPSQIAEAFHRDGYVVLRDILSPAFVAAALARAEENFAECRATIAAKGLHFGLHAKAGFKGGSRQRAMGWGGACVRER